MPVRGKIIMTNQCNRRAIRSLVFSAMDNLNQLSRTRELINILWDTQTEFKKNEQDWNRIEILLECYQEKRDKYLELAISDLEQLRQLITR